MLKIFVIYWKKIYYAIMLLIVTTVDDKEVKQKLDLKKMIKNIIIFLKNDIIFC